MTDRSSSPSLDGSAIREIVALAAANYGSTGTHEPALIVPENSKLVSLAPLGERPVRQEVTLLTHRPGEFCRYVEAEVSDSSVVFLHPDGSGAVAVIDFGCHAAPEWKKHRAVLDLENTPGFGALLRVCSCPVSQNDLAEFIEDWSDIVVPLVDGAPVALPLAAQAIRSVTIESASKATTTVADFEASESALAKISARSADGRLPGFLEFTCPIYENTQVVKLRVRVSLAAGDKPRFALRIVGLDAVRQLVLGDVERAIRDRVPKEVPVYVGRLR